MIVYEPLKDFIVIERAVAKGSKVVIPGSSEPASDDIFEVIKVGPGDDEHPQFLKPGELICLIGYINTFSFKGEKVILGRARDVMCIIKEE